MAKVIVERPRKGGGGKYPRARQRVAASRDFEDEPTHEPHKSRYFQNTKWLNENLAPLRRFLRSNLGKPWHEVHAEIAAQVPRDSAIQYHVWQHIQWDVAQDVTMVDGVPYRVSQLAWRRGFHTGFYVHPVDGTLRESHWHSARVIKLRKIASAPEPEVMKAGTNLEYHRVKGVWYAVTFDHAPGVPVISFDILKHEVMHHTGRYASAKRQLGKREIRRIIDPHLRRAANEKDRATKELAQLAKTRQTPGSFVFALFSGPDCDVGADFRNYLMAA
ncbi:MAG TPA: hypothetical protein VGN88_11350 [Phycisphaerae bacterium]|jgi:hypothetical protein